MRLLPQFLVCLSLGAAACGAEEGSTPSPYFNIVIDGEPVIADTAMARLDSTTFLTLKAIEAPTMARTRTLVIWVDSLDGPGTYTLQSDQPGPGDAIFQDDSDPSSPGFVGFSPRSAAPGWIQITNIDTLAHTITASFNLVAKQYVPAYGDSAVTITGSLYLPFTRTVR